MTETTTSLGSRRIHTTAGRRANCRNARVGRPKARSDRPAAAALYRRPTSTTNAPPPPPHSVVRATARPAENAPKALLSHSLFLACARSTTSNHTVTITAHASSRASVFTADLFLRTPARLPRAKRLSSLPTHLLSAAGEIPIYARAITI